MQEQTEATDTNAAAEGRRPILLICTVGGSPQPIASALRALRPNVVWFLISDGKSGPSSRSQVEDNDVCYDDKRGIRGPGLKLADGCPATCELFEIPADDPDPAYELCRSYLQHARKRYPDHHVIADYTGGTKSMTGALLMAAFAEPGVEVQFMVGMRPDLVQVTSGSERPQRMAADFIMAERDFAAAEQAVAGYDYAAAQQLLDDLDRRLRASTTPPQSFRDRLRNARIWTRVMADWDAFRHRPAADKARGSQKYGTWLSSALESTGHLDPLLTLGERRDGEPGWDMCADLWLNALRRGERGRYDDALARLYRLVEAAAQAWLWTRYGLKNSKIPWTQVPVTMRDGLQRRSDASGDCAQLALNQTVQFLRCCDPGDRFAAAYVGDWSGAAVLQGPPWLTQRNISILAHGFTSVSEKVWGQAKTWVEANVRSFFAEAEFPQLPRQIPPA